MKSIAQSAYSPIISAHSFPVTNAAQPAPALCFTVITASRPDRLSKIIGVDAEGEMSKESSAHMTAGTAQRTQVCGLEQLRDVLDGLGSDQAVCWGVAEAETAALCTERDDQAKAQGAIPRTRENFSFPTGPGVMMLDHDGLPGGELSADEFRQRLIDAVPTLATAPMLWRPSASAGCAGPDGAMLTPLTRHRLYIPVSDASRIPEAGRALETLLWARGDGWYIVSKSGQALKRTIVDTAVWQPERLDFAGQPILKDGVTRPGCAGRIYGDEAGLFDLEKIISLVTDAATRKAEAARREAREKVQDECAVAQAAWAQEHALGLSKRRKIDIKHAVHVLERAAQSRVLEGDFELTTQDGLVVTVGQILDDPDRWHGQRFYDPLEPNSDGRVAIARLLNGGRPDVFTHRHGGLSFELRRQTARIRVGKGRRVEATDAVIAVLRKRGELFEFGKGTLAHVCGGEVKMVSDGWLLDHLGRIVDFYSLRAQGKDNFVEVDEDAPKAVMEAIMAKTGQRGLRQLDGVVTAPTLRLDGSVLDKPGYDDATRLLYFARGGARAQVVPETPTPYQALDALTTLWEPFKLFPFVDGMARGTMLAGLLSACVRSVLPSCPGFGFDAPSAGSGKTLLAQSVGALATGSVPGVMSPTNDPIETRKRLFAALLGGTRVVIWDNCYGALGNETLDAFLTTSSFTDRVLSESRNVELPNKTLFLCSGNNMSLIGDTFRRIFMVRLDAGVEKPYVREFEFSPLERIQTHRERYVVAALTIMRAYICAGRVRTGKGRLASFEVWDDLVRQPVCWLAGLVGESKRDDLPILDDPVSSLEAAAKQSGENARLGALLEALFDYMQRTRKHKMTTREMVEATEVLNPDGALREALEDVCQRKGALDKQYLGTWIANRRDRWVNGYSFKLVSSSGNKAHWTVITEDGWQGRSEDQERAFNAVMAKRKAPTVSPVETGAVPF